LLPILHDVQAAFGMVPQEVLPQIAKAMNISKAEVHGVVTFYHDFREHRAGAHVVKLCRAEACQAVGADRVSAHARAVLGVDWHGTTVDGQVTLEPVFCLGLCACGPAALVDGRVVGRVDEARFDALVAGVRP
jgi:formate dehydrogenase subunit gamma